MTSISENEMTIQISCEWNVEHFCGNLSEKDALTETKIQNTWETIIIVLLEIINAVM